MLFNFKYKKCILSLFMICFFISSQAQYFKGGIMFGFTGSQMDGDYLDGFNKFGFSGGVFANRSFNNLWGMQAELKFILKGAAKPVSNSDASIYKMTLYYYELPVLATLKSTKKTMLESGIAFGYLSKVNFTNNDGTRDKTSDFNKTEISWIAGVYYFLNERFSVNMKFSYSLHRVSYIPGNLTLWGTYGQYNNVLNLSLYYTI